MAGDDNTLGSAIDEAQRAQTTEAREVAERRYRDILWVHHAREHELLESGDSAAWDAHAKEHAALAEQVKTALTSVESRAADHSTAHQAAHDAHGREHILEADARDKAAKAVDQRLAGMNEIRASLSDQAATFVRKDSFDNLVDRVIVIEKTDYGQSSRGQGYASLAGWIFAGFGFAATIISIVVVIANVLTSAKP